MSHEPPFSDDYPPDDPQFIPDDEPTRADLHPLFSQLFKKVLPQQSLAEPSPPPGPAAPPPLDPDTAAALQDLDRFIEVTRPQSPPPPPAKLEPPPPAPIAKMAPLPIAETFSPPPVEHLAADEVGPLEESGFDEPPFDENLPEESLPEAADSEAAPPRWTAPPPQSQSAFVNPALARVAAARPRPAGQREPGEFWLGLRTMVIVMSAALVVSFIFSYWTPNSFLPEDFVANLQEVSSTQGPPTFVPSPLPTFSQVKKIGIINGHSGPPLNPAFTEDPGAICDENGDGIPELRELDINTSVAYRVANLLVADGYEVEILNEWDARIQGYRADALISIHTNTCENLGFGANGFNMTAYERSPMIDRDNILVDCLVSTYTQATGLPRHFGSPPDLVDYHAFRKVSVDTPTVIIELGFMFADRQILVERPDDMAGGIFRGIDCFFQDPATRQEILSLSATPSP